MLLLDYFSYNNNLSKISIAEKLLLAGGCIILALMLPSKVTLVLIIIFMNITMIIAGIPLKYMISIWRIPLFFIMMSLIPIITGFSSQPVNTELRFEISGYYIYLNHKGLMTAEILLLRSTACISCLFMLVTTTPAAHIAAFFARFKVLREGIEIMLITYRFIFVLLETAETIYTAQNARLGYFRKLHSVKSAAMLASNIGVKSFSTVRQLYYSLQARNYNNNLVFRYPSQNVKTWRIVIIVCFLAGISATAIL